MRSLPDRRPPARLATAVFACCLMGALLVGVVAATFVPDYSRTVADRVIDRAVQTRTRSAAFELARALHADWQWLSHLAEGIARLPAETARPVLSAAVADGARIAGAGLAGLDGRLAVAAGGLPEGAEVRGEPWFDTGLRGRFAGLLPAAGPGADAAPHLAFALPARDAEGRVLGVVVMQLSFPWIERFLAEAAAVREIDLFLVNAAGEVLFGTDAVPPAAQGLQTFRAAAAGAATATRETWPDGAGYFASVVPVVAYGELPGLGWRLVGRLPGDAYEADRRGLLETLALLILGAVAVFGLAATLFSLVFVRPLARLVDSAERIADGQAVYPPETRTSAEAARLSAALARIQGRIAAAGGAASAPGREGEPPGKPL